MNIQGYETKREKVLAQSRFRQQSENLIDAVFYMLEQEELSMDWEQKAALVSHLDLLVSRAFIGGQIPSVNPKIFRELSPKSLELSKRVLKHFPTLPEIEQYLLAIHFSLLRVR